MQLRCIYVLCIVVVLMQAGCTKKLELPDIPVDKKVTMMAELVANDSFYVRAGQSVPMTKGAPLYFQIISGMLLSVAEDNRATFVLNQLEEEVLGSTYTLPFTSAKKVEPGREYTISCKHPELGVVNARVKIPVYFAAEVVDTAHIQYASGKAMQVDVAINDDINDAHYYVIEVLKQKVSVKNYYYYNNRWNDVSVYVNKLEYDGLVNAGVLLQKKSDTTFYKSYIRQPVYTNDANTENVKDGDIFAVNKRILLKDNSFNGQRYITRIVVRDETIVFEEEANKGVVHVMVKSVPKEYFEFLKAYEQHDLAAGFNSLAPPVKLPGNIDGGMGMIGAAYEQRFSYWFDYFGF